jgi:hypothetical protein
VGEDEWAEFDDTKKLKKGEPDSMHVRNGSQINLLPLNHRQMGSGDPNFGWGTVTSNDIEMATIVPNSSRLPSVVIPSTSNSSVGRKRY